ncbi:MAG: GWxTD domain-containing protein [Porphyromonadaceae bacterium]|nr:MAG: GWxTD domain-containing protein [Porphyromonadaceae bacterium]
MKKAIFLWACLTFLMITQVNAKELQALFYHASFFSPVEGPYVETYLKVFGPSAEYVKTARGAYQASLEVTILFKKNDKIIDFRKYNLLSAELEDTAKGQPHFIDQQRIPLPFGVYQLELILKDNHSKETPIENAYVLAMEFNKTDLKYSDFQFIESFQTTKQDNILSKSGFDLIPYVGDFFPSSVKTLTFYTELYNLDKKIGANQDFIYRYYLESFETNFSLGDFSNYQRQKASTVNPILATLQISDLPSGNYNLAVEARDRNNELISLNKIFFQRSNPGMQLNLSDIQSVDITSTFAEKITSLDSLKFYLQSLTPVSTMMEIQFAKNMMQTTEIKQMQKFLYNFWKTRNDKNPEAEWNRYKEQVLMIEDAYKTKIKHGFETDMGRTWLKYGAPDQVEENKHEPNAYPYIIWQFYHLGVQNNKRFLFYNPHLAGTEYILLHSDARGEIYNPYWMYELSGRTTNLRNYDEVNFEGGYGSRAWELFKK